MLEAAGINRVLTVDLQYVIYVCARDVNVFACPVECEVLDVGVQLACMCGVY